MRIFSLKTFVMSLLFASLMVACEEPTPTPKPEPTPTPTPDKPLVEGSFEVAVGEVTDDTVTITITPSEEVNLYYACLASDTKKYLGGEDEAIVIDQLMSPNAEQMIFTGEQTLTFGGLISHSHYRLLFFQYDPEKKDIFGELHRSERITTLDGEQEFTINVSNITGLSAEVEVVPNNAETTFYYWIDEAVDYTNKFEDSDNVLMQNDFAYWEFCASLTEDLYWYDIMQMDLHSGRQSVHTDVLYNSLIWNTEYMVYAYGLDNEGNVTTQMTKEYFTTKAPEKVDTTFDIEVPPAVWNEEYKQYELEAIIRPSNPDIKYFVTITNMDWYEWYFTDNNTGRSDEDFIIYQIIKNVSRPSQDVLEYYRWQGETTYRPLEVRQQAFYPNKRFGVFVFGLSEDGPTTPLTVYEVTTPGVPDSE